jgi:hypothetical protein
MTWHVSAPSSVEGAIGDLAVWPGTLVAVDQVPEKLISHLSREEKTTLKGKIWRFESVTPIGDIIVYEFKGSATCNEDRCLCAVEIKPNSDNPYAKENMLIIRGWKLIQRRPLLGHASGNEQSVVLQFENAMEMAGLQVFYDGLISLERVSAIPSKN